MKFFKWFFIGCLFVGIPFAIGYDRHDLWPPVMYGAAGGIVFLLLFFFSTVRKIFSMKEMVFTGALFLILSLAFAAHSVNMYRMTSYYRGLLPVIRTYIGSALITSSELHDRAIPVLRHFYSQPKGKNQSIVESFKQMNDSTIVRGEFTSRPQTVQIRTFVSYQGDSLVRLVSIDTVAQGLKNDFSNIAGYHGKLQYTATISKHGAAYERNN